MLVIGAGNGTRTRDFHLGKVVLYQLSYSRFFDQLLWLSKLHKQNMSVKRKLFFWRVFRVEVGPDHLLFLLGQIDGSVGCVEQLYL